MVDKDSHTWKYGRYRIDRRFQPKIGRNRPSMWIHTKNKSDDFFWEVRGKRTIDLWSHIVPSVMRNGPGHTSAKKLWSHGWWEMVPTAIWMSIPIHRFIDPVDRSWSISTVDKDSPTGEYGRYRRSMPIHLQRITVDRRWSIKNRDNLLVNFIDDTCVYIHIHTYYHIYI